MKTLLIIITSVAFTIVLNIGELQAQAGCVACFQTVEGCSTEIVESGGYSEGCGCRSGCKCYGEICNPEHTEILINNSNELKSLDIPMNGYFVNLLQQSAREILSEFTKGGLIGNQTIDNVYFGSQIGIYELSDGKLMAFPLREEKFDLIGCDGSVLASIKRAS